MAVPFLSPNDTQTREVHFSAIGIIFGLTIASYFFHKKSLIQLLLFALTCAFGFLIIANSPYLEPLPGGLLGLIIAFGFHMFLSKLTTAQFILLTLVGGIFALIGLLLLSVPIHLTGSSLFPLDIFIIFIWQTTMAAALGYCVEQNEKKTPAKKKK